jgi:DNA primase
LYHNTINSPLSGSYNEVDELEQRPSFRKPIETIKEAVPIETYAAELTSLRRSGENLVGLCPLHNEKTPSFVVYPDHFYCFGCKAHGDVIELCEQVEVHADAWTAMISLAKRYGVEIPERPDSWYRRDKRRAEDLHELRRVYAASYRRRLFKTFFVPYLEEVSSELRDEEARRIWEELWRPAWIMAGRRVEK